MDISIIGAGPSGNYLAFLLSKNKKNKVTVLEDHKKIGCPIQCTGILTNSINNILKLPKSIIANKITKLKIISPNNQEVLFNFKEPNIIVKRDKFDQYLAKLAIKSGAKYLTNSRYLSNTFSSKNSKKNKVNLSFRNTLNKEEKILISDILVGADGPNSLVAKNNNLFKKRDFVMGHQILTKLPLSQDTILVYLGEGEFSWVVPEGNSLFRLGLVAKNNSKAIFDKFVGRIEKETKTKIVELQNQSGPIPLFNNFQKTINKEKNILLLGDAASQVKATSYGGIIHGLLAAECINNYLTSHHSKYKYLKELNSKVSKELLVSLLLRKVMNKFTEKDYNVLVSYLQKEKARKILENFDRDFPSKFLFKMFLAQPKLARFVTKLF